MALAVTAGQPHLPGFYGAAHPSAQNRGAAALPTDFPTFVPLQRSPEPGIRPRCRPHRLPAAELPAHGRADEISLAGFHRTLTRRPSSQSLAGGGAPLSHQSPPMRLGAHFRCAVAAAHGVPDARAYRAHGEFPGGDNPLRRRRPRQRPHWPRPRRARRVWSWPSSSQYEKGKRDASV